MKLSVLNCMLDVESIKEIERVGSIIRVKDDRGRVLCSASCKNVFAAIDVLKEIRDELTAERVLFDWIPKGTKEALLTISLQSFKKAR